ncbi:MAG: hypothetical protein QM784_27950 [Polyangiaceae bacterium]
MPDPQAIRLKLRRNQFVDGLIDLGAPLTEEGEGATPPTFVRGTAVNFEVAFANSAGAGLQSLAGIESVTLAILEPGAGGRSYYQSTKVVADLNDSLDLADFDDGTDESATWALTSGETNIPMASEARPLVLTFWATTEPDGLTGERQRYFLGGGYLQELDPGVGGEIAPPDPLPYPAVTIGEVKGVVEAILGGISVLSLVATEPTLYGSSGALGHVFVNPTTGRLKIHNGTGWTEILTSDLPVS